MALYFAYGSNLATSRMRDRIPAARVVGRARLDGHQLTFDKLGRDGSGKANIARSPGAIVWGVLYALESEDLSRLDEFEPGYDRVTLDVILDSGESCSAVAYRAIERKSGLVPLTWYMRFIIEGAQEHELPEAYRLSLEALPEE